MITEPVVGKDFFGREDFLDLLNKRAIAIKEGYRQNIAVLGERFLGKTSLLHQFILSLSVDNFIVPVYIEIRLEPFYDFANRFINTLLFYFLRTECKDVPQDIDELMEKCNEYIPETIKVVKNIHNLLSKNELDEVYNLLFDLPSIIKREREKYFVIVLDEFQNLNKFIIKNAYKILGKKIMVQEHAMYVVSSSYYNEARNIIDEKLSLLFGQFQVIKINQFSDIASEKYLTEKLFPINVSDSYKQFIANITSGHPFYLDIIGTNLKRIANFYNCKKVSLNQLTDSLENCLFNSKGILTQYFSNKINILPLNKESIHILILMAIADNNNKMKSIKNFVGKRYGKDISKPLNILVKTGLIERYGRFFKFNDTLLKIWIKYVYQSKYNSIHIDVSKRADYFKQQIKEYFLDFISVQDKSINSRIMQLYQCFHNDIIPILGHKRRLPYFDEVYEDKIGDAGPFIFAYTKGKVWVTYVIKEKFVQQDNVQEFLQACKRSRRNIYRKIFISGNGMHVNAKILAKEKRIWLWSLNELNYLMQLYGKEKVIR